MLVRSAIFSPQSWRAGITFLFVFYICRVSDIQCNWSLTCQRLDKMYFSYRPFVTNAVAMETSRLPQKHSHCNGTLNLELQPMIWIAVVPKWKNAKSFFGGPPPTQVHHHLPGPNAFDYCRHLVNCLKRPGPRFELNQRGYMMCGFTCDLLKYSNGIIQ